MQTEKCLLNDLGPATCLQTVAPTGISRRNSLPALNAMPAVQVPQAYSASCENGPQRPAGRYLSWLAGSGSASTFFGWLNMLLRRFSAAE